MLVFILVAILIELTATVNGGILNPKVYSVQPGAQCQAQQAVHNINRSVFKTLSTLVRLPPPCGHIGPWTRVAFLNMSDPFTAVPAILEAV